MKRLLAVVAVALASVIPARAHEIGKTQVAALFGNGRYQIDVTVDPDALLTKLEVFGGITKSSPADRTDRDRHIQSLSLIFLDHFFVAFDGHRVRATFEYRPAPLLSDLVRTPSVVRLTGVVPDAARSVTLAYGLAMGSYAVNIRIGDSPVQTEWLDGGAESAPTSLVAPPPPPTRLEVARQYFALGFTHILPKGLDHILFVLGIFLLSVRWRSVLLQVSTFTLAHSITLGLTMYGVISLQARVVEPLIALSIAYVAIENLLTSELKPWRLALVFSFGLLHGMGFAGVLRDLGLPRSEFLTALLTFNVGVEAGQLAVIALASLAVAYWRRNQLRYRRLVIQPASLVIALTGIYWTLQRAFL